MGKQKKKQKKRGNPLWTLVFLAALAVFCFSGYKLIGIYLDYKTGTDEYRDLQQYTTEITKTPETPAPTKTEDPQAESEPAEPSEPEPEPLSYPTEPPLAVDFESLKAINPDVKGWLYIEALDISYPVVQGPDNDAYLHTTYEGTSNFAGSIFLDYQNQGDFSDGNTIVYGHNMKNGSMFANIKKFTDQDYFNNHPEVYIYLPDGSINVYSIYSTKIIDATSDYYLKDIDYASYVANAKSSAKQSRDVDTQNAAPLLLLSTCYAHDTPTRSVLFARLEKNVK